MQAKLSNGQWLPGFAPGTSAGFVEGTSAQYTPMVPFNIQALINARGGNAAWVSFLNSLTSNLTNPSSTNADLSNEPSLEIPYEYDYAGAPYLTQRVVRNVGDQLYFDAPVGQDGNDDLGAMSSAYVWDELGFYPETPRTPTLALGSPVFPKAVVRGSTQQIPVAFSDWTLGAGAYRVLSADTVAATTPYRNIDDGTQDSTTTYVYSVSAALQSGKTVATVTLPSPSGGYIGVFAIGGA